MEDAWTYDPAGALGQPLAAQRSINGATERWTGQAYDALARPVQSTVVQALASGMQTYVTRTRYDSYHGRPIGLECDLVVMGSSTCSRMSSGTLMVIQWLSQERMEDGS